MPEPPIRREGPHEGSHARAARDVASTVRSRPPKRSRGDSARDTLDEREDVSRDVVGPGTTVGRYVIVRWLGAGGMGAVYEARDPDLERPVAIKLLHGEVNERARLRMEREARALARLSHPNVVQVHEIGRADSLVTIRIAVAIALLRWLPRCPCCRCAFTLAPSSCRRGRASLTASPSQ